MDAPSIIDALATAVPGANAQAVPSVDMETILVDRDAIVDVCRFLHDDAAMQFGFLSDVIGVALLFTGYAYVWRKGVFDWGGTRIED